MSALLQLDCATLGYDGRPILRDLSASISQGALIALVGANGAGKSTLLKAMAGRIKPQAGRLRWAGGSAPRISYMPQHAAIERAFPISTADFASGGLWRRLGFIGGMSSAMRDERDAALEATGLASLRSAPLASLSGGQMQRALFARIILEQADLLLLDEPFTGLDGATADRFMALIETWRGQGRTTIAALHDLEAVRRRFPETMLLARALVGFGRTEEVLGQGSARAEPSGAVA